MVQRPFGLTYPKWRRCWRMKWLAPKVRWPERGTQWILSSFVTYECLSPYRMREAQSRWHAVTIHHPRLYEVPEHPVPAVLAQPRRETIPIHDYTGAGTSFSAHHGTKTLRTNVSEMKALLTYEMVGTQGALTPQIHWVLIHPNCLLEDRTTPLRCASLLLWVLLISYPSYRLT